MLGHHHARHKCNILTKWASKVRTERDSCFVFSDLCSSSIFVMVSSRDVIMNLCDGYVTSNSAAEQRRAILDVQERLFRKRREKLAGQSSDSQSRQKSLKREKIWQEGRIYTARKKEKARFLRFPNTLKDSMIRL